MDKIIIVGIGNPFRSDDAAGWAVIDRLEKKINQSITLKKIRGDIVDLLDVFTNYSHVYLVDACLADDPESSWQRIDALKHPLPIEQTQTSTHGISVSQAIGMAQSLDQLPAKLIVYAIPSTQFAMSSKIAPEVEKAMTSVVQAILNEEDIHACMNKV